MTDPTSTWADYYARKRDERLAEAESLWKAMEAASVSKDTPLALDFEHFAPNEEAAEAMRQQLSENYTATTEPGPDGYVLVKGTTRPHGVTLDADTHRRWVEYMCETARQHGGGFTRWTLTSPAMGQVFDSETYCS